eukprot:Polyplicarium_translucidae@DN2163_c0_g1_i2.p1
MISQFYVLSPRGDTIINRDFRGDIVKGTAEIFLRKAKFWDGDAPPVFSVDGVNYFFLKRHGLYFVCTTMYNVPPLFVLELLDRTTKVFKDFCGVLNEEAVRKNFTLIYEILDEMIDSGYPQITSTERLKQHVYNEALPLDTPVQTAAAAIAAVGFPQRTPKTVPSHASHRPIGAGQGEASARNTKNEVFVDILERQTVVLNSSGSIINSSIDGSIQMKSFLSGAQELRLALNEDVVVRNESAYPSAISGGVVLDDCNFHECADLRDFDSQRIISFVPPDGEFTLMNFRVTSDFRLPFRVFPIVEQVAPLKLEIMLKVRADIPETKYGGNVVIACPVPKRTVSCSTDVFPATSGDANKQSVEFVPAEGRVVWTIKKFQGGTERSLRCRLSLASPQPQGNGRKDVGPVSLSFEIPMYNVSNLQVRYLRASESSGVPAAPFRWVRYLTQSASYICRL